MLDTGLDSTNSRVTVSLPDMFKSFLVGDPVVNPHYELVRDESEKWLQSAMLLSPIESKRVNYCNFSYFVAVLIAQAPKEKLKIACDWGNWVFMFDDMFDEGHLRNDVDASQNIIRNLLSIMLPELDRLSEEPVVTAHDSIYIRLAAGSSPRIIKRYVDAMKAYCAGALQHVEDYAADRMPTVPEMLETRRMSIGVFPMYLLVEFAYDLNLPDEVFLHPYYPDVGEPRSRMEECPFNTVAVCRMSGASAQHAFDEIASLIDARFDLWDETVKTLPHWGEKVDSQVRQYIQGIQNIVQANLSWR
ncbi:hypothetical protein PG989_014214 [Apiospora arundinis]